MRLDMYDDFPSGMRSYLKAYGWHFSKAMCDWAVSMMEKEDGNGKKVKITPFTKEQVDEMLKKYSVDVKKKGWIRLCLRRQHVQGRLPWLLRA